MHTIKDMIEHNKFYGYNFFNKTTMKFWNSHICSGLFNDRYFITSEDNYDRTEIRYSIRGYDWDTGLVDTIGKFQAYATLEEAIDALNTLLSKTEYKKKEIPKEETKEQIIQQVIDAIEEIDWYHILNGQLIHGANSKEDEPLYKAKDIYDVLDKIKNTKIN